MSGSADATAPHHEDGRWTATLDRAFESWASFDIRPAAGSAARDPDGPRPRHRFRHRDFPADVAAAVAGGGLFHGLARGWSEDGRLVATGDGELAVPPPR